MDPLADHPKLVGYSPFVYAVNNPVLHTDPDGKCPPWICGAIAGDLVEAGSQFVTNLAKGDSFLDAAKNIDGADVLAATIEGGVTGGGSVARRLLVKGTAAVVSKVVQASIDIELDGDTDIIGTEGSNKSVGQVATETAIGLGANVAREFTEAGLKAATNSKATKELTQVNRELKKSMKGSQGEATRLSKQAGLNSTIKGNNVVAKATGTVTTEVIDEKAKSNQRL